MPDISFDNQGSIGLTVQEVPKSITADQRKRSSSLKRVHNVAETVQLLVRDCFDAEIVSSDHVAIVERITSHCTAVGFRPLARGRT